MVLAWMMPHSTDLVDTEGEYGTKGSQHRLMQGTLVRDLFVKAAGSWLRVQHDKLVPNGMVVEVDGVPRIIPPLDGQHQVTPLTANQSAP